VAVVLALVSALAYGLSDFVGGIVSRRVSAWSVAVLGAVSSTLCTAVVAVFVTGDPGPGDFAWGLLAGLGTGAGTGFLYRGFASGRMSVVAPVSAVGAAVVPALAGTLSGEQLSVLVWVGLAVALPGIWLVSSSPDDPLTPDASPDRNVAAGFVDGVLAGLGFGVLFAALGQVPESAGWWPLTLSQALSVPVVALLATALRADWRPRGRAVLPALACGPLGAAATGFFLLATQQGYLTVAGVLTSLYPASTVLLAAVVLHERVHRLQGLGLVLCGLAVACVAAG